MRPVLTWLLALTLLGAPPAPGAAAQDPDPDSPSGHIYEIPLDDGRGDAAPRRSGEDRGSGTRSSIRSENNFGSSSSVPGAGDGGTGDAGSDGAAGAAGPAGGAAAQPSGSGGGSGGGGSGDGASGSGAGTTGRSGEPPERSAAAGESAPATAAAPPSYSRALLLVGLGVVVAAGLGLAARRR